jgi:hypothetical protein
VSDQIRFEHVDVTEWRCCPIEVADVLRQTLRHLPADPLVESGMSGFTAANLAWEIDSFISRSYHRSAIRFSNNRVRPEIARLAEPYRDPVVANDRADPLLRSSVRP